MISINSVPHRFAQKIQENTVTLSTSRKQWAISFYGVQTVLFIYAFLGDPVIWICFGSTFLNAKGSLLPKSFAKLGSRLRSGMVMSSPKAFSNSSGI